MPVAREKLIDSRLLLELLTRLMEALQHAVFHYIGEAQNAVGRSIVELGRIDQATVQRRHNLAARKRVN